VAAARAGATWAAGDDVGTAAPLDATVADAGVEDDNVALDLVFLRLFLPMVGRFVGLLEAPSKICFRLADPSGEK
jgi:hypothetical protein